MMSVKSMDFQYFGLQIFSDGFRDLYWNFDYFGLLTVAIFDFYHFYWRAHTEPEHTHDGKLNLWGDLRFIV